MQPGHATSDPDETHFFSREVASLAPFALDRTPAPTSTEANARLERTVSIRREHRTDKRVFALAVCAIAALSLVSAVSLRVPQAAHAPAESHTRRVVAANEALLIPVLTAPAKDLILLDEDDAASIPVSALPGERPSASAARHAPRGGLLRVPSSVAGVLVDGAPHRVEHGLVALPCGTHTIKAAAQPARSVVIACAGTTTL